MQYEPCRGDSSTKTIQYKKTPMAEQNKIEIYQSADKQTVVEVQFEQETVWLNRPIKAKFG